jgi:hypothetical protein
MKQGLFSIELTAEEIALADAVQFDPLTFHGDHQAFLKNAELVCQLATSLLERDGVPEPRRRYFTDPEYNPGGRGRSRMGGFERNGTSGEAILRHPHFLKYLRYFIYGADLPVSALQAFKRAVEECGPITSGDIAPLGATARQLARTHRLEGGAAADEFYKLCLDLNMSPSNAASIRASVQQLRTRR